MRHIKNAHTLRFQRFWAILLGDFAQPWRRTQR
jgi:hypothetical protein